MTTNQEENEMKKFKTDEEKVAFVAKTLVKWFKADSEARRIHIVDRFSNVCSGRFTGVHRVFRSGYADEVDFGELSDEGLGSLTCRIADAVCARLKVRKSEILYRDEEEHSKWTGTWYGGHSTKYRTCRGIDYIRPCKGFIAINRKLKALGVPEINFRDWYHCEVAGKRSSVFSRDYRYYAESEKKCQKVLDYLKGRRKVSYDYVSVDDLEDRRRGEEYETEWYGSESQQIWFKDSQGKMTIIY